MLIEHSFGQVVDLYIWASLAGELAEMPVVSEVNDLSDFRHLRKQSDGLSSAEVIKGFHDVVGDEGNRASGLGKLEIPATRKAR